MSCKKRRSLFLIVFNLLLVLNLFSQTFQRGIGMESFDKGNALRLLPDHGFIVGGETENIADQERDMLLIRTDSAGNLLWSKSYGGPEREVVNDVVQTPDFGFMFAAEKYQPHKMVGENLTIAKTDASGNLQWKKIYEEGGNETEGFSMQHTPDNAYIVAGMVKKMSLVSNTFYNVSSENQGLYVLKVDGSGNKIWSRRFDYGLPNVSSTGTSVILSAGGGYIITGNFSKTTVKDSKTTKPEENGPIDGTRSMMLVKVKPDGSLQWARDYESDPVLMGYMVIQTSSGGLMVAGNTTVSPTNMDMFLMSLDADGNMLWAKTYGGPRFESVADVAELPDGGFTVSGMTESFGAGGTDVLSFKTDNRGNIQWAKSYGGIGSDNPSKIAVTNNGIVVTGTTASFNSHGFDVLLMKTDLNGNSGCPAIGKNVVLTTAAFQPVLQKIAKPSMQKVEQGVMPPNMQKPDAGNIVEKKTSAAHNRNLCE